MIVWRVELSGIEGLQVRYEEGEQPTGYRGDSKSQGRLLKC